MTLRPSACVLLASLLAALPAFAHSGQPTREVRATLRKAGEHLEIDLLCIFSIPPGLRAEAYQARFDLNADHKLSQPERDLMMVELGPEAFGRVSLFADGQELMPGKQERAVRVTKRERIEVAVLTTYRARHKPETTIVLQDGLSMTSNHPTRYLLNALAPVRLEGSLFGTLLAGDAGVRFLSIIEGYERSGAAGPVDYGDTDDVVVAREETREGRRTAKKRARRLPNKKR